MNVELPPEPRRAPSRRRLFLAGLVVAVIVFAAAFGISRLLGSSATSSPPVSFAPAQENEFLIVVAPFRREGGEPQPLGGTLANDLRLEPAAAERYRVEMLPRAPESEEIAGLLATYTPHILVSGSYDESDVRIRVELQPPARPATTAVLSNGGGALIPSTGARHYELYAPLGLDRPLRYVQAWIVGQSYFWQGAYDQALPSLQDAKRQLPRQSPLPYRAGMDHFAAELNWQLGYIAGPIEGNWQAARDIFREALRLSPQDPAPALGLAASLAQLNDLEGAATILRQALRGHANAWQIHFALAEIAQQQGDSGVAFTNYERAITLLSASPLAEDRFALADIYFSRGYYRLTSGDPAGAAADMQQALDLGRDDVFVQANLGWAAYLMGDYETAVRASAAARQMAPERPDLAFNEALHLLAAGQIDAARTAYGEAIDLTLGIDDVLTRSNYFGAAFNDLAELAERQPELAETAAALQERIDIANG